MSQNSSPLESIAWNHAGKLFEYGAAYATSILVARALGVEANGELAGLLSIVQLLQVLSSLGLETSINKHLPQFKRQVGLPATRFVLRRLLLLRLALAVIVVAAFLGLVSALPVLFSRPVRDTIWIMIFLTISRSLIPLLSMTLTTQLRTERTAVINGAVRAGELIAVALLGSGLTVGGMVLLFASFALLHLFLFIFATRESLFGRELAISLVPVVGFGAVYWVNTVVDYFLGRQGDILLLSHLLPNGAEASIYDVASSLARVAVMGATVGLGGLTLVALARVDHGSSEASERLYAFLVRMFSLLTIPVFVYLLFNAEGVIHTLYSPAYENAVPLLQGIMVFRIATRLFGAPENADFLLARGRTSTVVLIGLAGAVVNIGLDLSLIPRFGAWGAVVASAVANIGVNASSAIQIYRISNARMQPLFWSVVTGLCCIAGLAVRLLVPALSPAALVAQAIIYAGLVLALMAVVRPLSSADREWLTLLHPNALKYLRPFLRGAI